jgi:hypothetical protein
LIAFTEGLAVDAAGNVSFADIIKQPDHEARRGPTRSPRTIGKLRALEAGAMSLLAPVLHEGQHLLEPRVIPNSRQMRIQGQPIFPVVSRAGRVVESSVTRPADDAHAPAPIFSRTR